MGQIANTRKLYKEKIDNITKTEEIMAAVRNFIIWVPTAVPKMLAPSLAPSDHPKNKPLLKKNRKLSMD